MWLREVVFQGVFDLDRPARIRVDPGFCRLDLPEGASPGAFRSIVLSLLYPHRVGVPDLLAISNGDGSGLRLGLVIETGEGPNARTFKLYRRLEDDSVVLQRGEDSGRGREIARGAQDVGAALVRRLGLPEFTQFCLVHCWDHSRIRDPSPSYASTGAGSAVPVDNPEVNRLLEMRKLALRMDKLDMEMDGAQADLSDARRLQKQLARVVGQVRGKKGRIEQIERALNLPADERNTIINFRQLKDDLLQKRDDLDNELGAKREEEEQAHPGGLAKDKVFVSCVILAVAIFVASSLSGTNSLAFLNLGFLGGAAWSLLRRYDKLEDTHVTHLRTEQLGRHIEATLQDLEKLESDNKRLLKQLDINDGSDLENMERELKDLRRSSQDEIDPEVEDKLKDADDKVKKLEELVEDIEARKESIGESHLPVYEIDNQLADYGIDTYALGYGENDSADGPALPVSGQMAVFPALMDAAEQMSMTRDGRLRTRARKSWLKMLTHVFGKGMENASLSREGALMVDADNPEATLEWVESQSAYIPAVSGLLAAGLIVASKDNGPCRFMCLADPYDGLDDNLIEKLDTIFEFLGKDHHVLVLG